MLFFIKNNPQKLLSKYNNSGDQNISEKKKIIKRLIELDAEEQLLTIFIRGNKTSKNINNYLFEKYQNDSKQLLHLYNQSNSDDYKDKITMRLISLSAQKELSLILRNINAAKYYLFRINASDVDFIQFFQKNNLVLELLRTHSELFLYFFSKLKSKYQLYFLLSHFGINRFIESIQYRGNYPELEKYYASVSDCQKCKMSIFADLFEIVYKKAIEEKDIKLLKLSFLLNSVKFIKKVLTIKEIKHIVTNVDNQKIGINTKYSNLLTDAKNKTEVEKLLQEKQKEISELYPEELYLIQKSLIKNTKKILKKDNVFSSNTTIFSNTDNNSSTKKDKILFDYQIVKNVDEEKEKIQINLKNQLSYLHNADEIMKLKSKVEKQNNQFISIGNYCHLIQNLNSNYSNNKEIVDKLGEVLVKSEFIDVKKSILKFSESSNNRLWLKYIHKIKHHKELRYLILASIKNKTSCWNLLFLKDMINNRDIPLLKTITSHSSSVNSVVFSPNGEILAFTSRDNTIKLWDVRSGKELKTLTGHSDNVFSVVFSPNGKILASGSNDETIRLWDVSSGKELKTSTGYSKSIFSVAFSPNGEILASGSSDKTIKLWSVESGSELKTLTGHSNNVFSVVFSPNGKILASGSYDYNIKLWDIGSGKELKTLTGHSRSVLSVAFSPNGEILASGSNDGTIKLWDVGSGKVLKTLTGHSDGVNFVAFSPNGEMLASGSNDRTVKLWDASSGKELETLTGHSGYIFSVAFPLNGEILASGSADGTIKLWNIEALTMKPKFYLIEHLLHFLLNPDERDIPDLTKFLYEIPKLPQDMQQPVKQIVEEIINRAGRQSKSIEIAEENNPTSKDLEIVY